MHSIAKKGFTTLPIVNLWSGFIKNLDYDTPHCIRGYYCQILSGLFFPSYLNHEVVKQ